MSYTHWRVTGKSITKLPFNGIAVLGVMLTSMSPVVLVMDGLKVRPQDVNWSGTRVMIELESPAGEEKSLPTLTVNGDVVKAGVGFSTLEIVITIMFTAKLFGIPPVITSV
jgi:hypothetical protein